MVNVEVMKRALEVMHYLEALNSDTQLQKVQTITELKEAISEAEKREPDAWIITFEKQNGDRETCAAMGRYKDVEASCDFGKPIPLYKHPPAVPVQKNVWEMFPAYLIDKCEGEIITEEGLQRSLADMLTDPSYTALPAVQPEQQEWIGLTPEDIRLLEEENPVEGYYGNYYPAQGLVKAVENKLKEKNTKKG